MLNTKKVKISKVPSTAEKIPYDLLLTADPSMETIEDYLSRGETFIAEYEGDVIGVYVLIRTKPQTIELVNLAVDESVRGLGLGKKLVFDSVENAREMGAKTVELGTGNSSIDQLALYQKCGFRLVGIDRDFFLRHYEEEIHENGIQCVDMIRLALDLESEDS